MSRLEAWWAGGEHVTLTLGGHERGVFVRRVPGAGAPATLLHGFPSSSHDWAPTADLLAGTVPLLLCDFLGFGASDKPRDHVYSIHEQADLVEALWAREGVTQTTLVGHDYAVSVVQELLARRGEGALTVDIHAVVLLNGGLYPDLHRPEPVQTALLDPEQGPALSAALTEQALVGALAPTWGAGFTGAQEAAADIWASLARDDGYRNLHLLIRYMLDRQEHAARWTTALEQTDVPRWFVWGLLDPISGAHMLERVRERIPEARIDALADVGHWPPLEAPERTAAAIQEASGPTTNATSSS